MIYKEQVERKRMIHTSDNGSGNDCDNEQDEHDEHCMVNLSLTLQLYSDQQEP